MTQPTEKTLYVAYTNTDCTEGRGSDVPVAICEYETTARRLAKRIYVQGGDGPVRPVKLLWHEGGWYAPLGNIPVVKPTADDLAEDTAIRKRNLAIEKAKKAGLTDDDIMALSATYRKRTSR